MLLSRRSAWTGLGAATAGLWLGSRATASAAADPARPGRLRYQGWAGTVLFPELAEALGFLAPLTLDWVGNTSSGPQDLQAATGGDTEFAGAFNGSVMRLIGAGAPVKAVIAYGGADRASCCGLFVPADSPIRSAGDLVGRTVGVNTLRAQQECFVDSYMRAAGLDRAAIGEVTLVQVPPVIAEAALRHRRIDVAALPQFFRDEAIARGGLRELVNDHALYGAANMDSLILRDSYVARFPDEAAHFVAATARAIAWAQERPRAEVVARLVEIVRARRRGESEGPVRLWTSTAVATRGGVITPSDFTRFGDWYGWRGDRHTASLPTRSLYTNGMNPYRAA